MTDQDKVNAEPIALGALHGAYGLKGWVRIQPFQSVDSLLFSKNWFLIGKAGTKPIEVEGVKEHGNGLIAKIKGIETPEQAKELKGAVGLLREDFPDPEEGVYYSVDLQGCQVVNPDKTFTGKVTRVIDNGVHDVLEVIKPDNKVVLIPFVDNYVISVDLESKKVTVDWDPSWD